MMLAVHVAFLDFAIGLIQVSLPGATCNMSHLQQVYLWHVCVVSLLGLFRRAAGLPPAGLLPCHQEGYDAPGDGCGAVSAHRWPLAEPAGLRLPDGPARRPELRPSLRGTLHGAVQVVLVWRCWQWYWAWW